MKKKTIIMGSVGLAMGIGEALLFYRLGKKACAKFPSGIPRTKEFLKTSSIMIITSFLTAGISGWIESQLDKNEKKNQSI